LPEARGKHRVCSGPEVVFTPDGTFASTKRVCGASAGRSPPAAPTSADTRSSGPYVVRPTSNDREHRRQRSVRALQYCPVRRVGRDEAPNGKRRARDARRCPSCNVPLICDSGWSAWRPSFRRRASTQRRSHIRQRGVRRQRLAGPRGLIANAFSSQVDLSRSAGFTRTHGTTGDLSSATPTRRSSIAPRRRCARTSDHPRHRGPRETRGSPPRHRANTLLPRERWLPRPTARRPRRQSRTSSRERFHRPAK
jgi:hypothetical protein